MPHWKIILTYDGTHYNGWQVQPNLPTVQGTLAHALRHITGETVLPQGSGRTDTGVHALAQVATFSLTVPIPAANLHHALNRALPPSIRILSVEAVPAEFHARHNALRKTYEYRILPGNQICSPMLAPFVWACPFTLDLPRLQQAAAHILGTHDFTSFAASDPDLTTRNKPTTNTPSNTANHADNHPPDPASFEAASSEPASFDAIYFAQLDSDIVAEAEDEASATATTASKGRDFSPAINPPEIGRLQPLRDLTPASSPPTHATNTRTIHHSAWHQHEDLLIYRVTGSGFLHHMVRNLVGTFAEAGSGRISPEAIPTILAARNRHAAGPTAPARGLFLVEVIY
jgi:tRNA pseudouridine38-40 synthase